MWRRLRGDVIRISGWVVLVTGVTLFLTPLPAGLPLMSLGIVILWGRTKTLTRGMIWLRARYPEIRPWFRIFFRRIREKRIISIPWRKKSDDKIR